MNSVGKMEPKEKESCMQKLIEDVKFSLHETLTSLEEVWDDIGIKEEEKEVRLDTVATHIQELLTEMLNEECELKAKLELNVVEYKKELEQLYHDLHLPQKPNPKTSLVALENQLRNDVDTLNKEKHDRLKWLRRIRAEEQSICVELVMTQHEINFIGTPSLEQLRELEQNISFLKSEKSKRCKLFEVGRKEILSLWSKLEIDAENEFEKNIKNDTLTILSSQNIKKIEELKSKLENDHAELLLQIHEKRDQYKLLLDRLEQQLNALEKDGLQEVPADNSTSTLKILNLNIAYLQKLKSRHLESFVQAIRTELEDLWNKCYFGEEQRRNFIAFYTVDFTEEILADHEHQLNSMKFYYEDNKELFKLVLKREALWEEKISIESNSEGNAKFNNRGGALMKALKKKQFVDKQLPKVSTQLKTKIGNWEQENETVFLFNGYRYIDHMDSQKQSYEAGLQMKKDKKQHAKIKEMSPCGNKSTIKKFMPKSANGRSPLKRGQSNLSHTDTVNATHSIFRSPLTKKKKTQISSCGTGPPSSSKSFRTTPSSVANISKYSHTHSSLQNSENVIPKPTRKVIPVVVSKLTSQSRKKSLKRRSIKVRRVLKERNNYDIQEASVLKEKLEPNVSIVSYDEFSHRVADVPFSRSSYLEEPEII